MTVMTNQGHKSGTELTGLQIENRAMSTPETFTKETVTAGDGDINTFVASAQTCVSLFR
jgi:hypothetical protein